MKYAARPATAGEAKSGVIKKVNDIYLFIFALTGSPTDVPRT